MTSRPSFVASNPKQMLPLFQIISSSVVDSYSSPQLPTAQPELLTFRPPVIPQKPRRNSHRKHLEVGVHKAARKMSMKAVRSDQGTSAQPHKHTFSANFHSERYRQKATLPPNTESFYQCVEDVRNERGDFNANEDGERQRDTKKNERKDEGDAINQTEKEMRDNEKSNEMNMSQKNEPDYLIGDVSNFKDKKNKVSKKMLKNENESLKLENKQLLEKLRNVVSDKEIEFQKLFDRLEQFQHYNQDFSKENELLRQKLKERVVQSCENCIEMKKIYDRNVIELENRKKENVELKEDIKMLKNVVYRLNVQLEKYQEKLRSQSNNLKPSNIQLIQKEINFKNFSENKVNLSNIDESHTSHQHAPVSWGSVNTHTLGPLLDAYQEGLQEKDEIIQGYEKEIDTVTGRLKDILEENTKLHKAIDEDAGKCMKNEVELNEMTKQMKLLKEQNEMLTRKCNISNDKMQEFLKCYEQKVETMTRDYETLHAQYHKSRSDLCTLQGKYQVLVETHEAQKIDKENTVPISVYNSSVNECKRLFEELKTQYESEKSKMSQQLKILEQQNPNMEKELIDLKTEKHELEMNMKSMEKMLKRIQQKYDQTQSALITTQMSRDTCRRQLQKAFSFSRELVHEQETLLSQLAEKHRENRQMHIVGTGIVTKMDSLKTQLKTIQQEALQSLDNVEQRIQEQDLSMEAMKRQFDTEIQRLNQLLTEKDEVISKLQAETTEGFQLPSYLSYKDRSCN